MSHAGSVRRAKEEIVTLPDCDSCTFADTRNFLAFIATVVNSSANLETPKRMKMVLNAAKKFCEVTDISVEDVDVAMSERKGKDGIKDLKSLSVIHCLVSSQLETQGEAPHVSCLLSFVESGS